MAILGCRFLIVVVIITVCMLSTMIFTYTTCVKQHECPSLPHLPTVSNTWERPPGNYVSRFVVGNVSLWLGFLQFALWRPLQERPRWCLPSAVFSTICLSVVGAVCDSATIAQCRGDNSFHTAAATIFFVLYAINQIAFSYYAKESLLVPLAAASAVLKLRLVPGVLEAPSAAHDQTYLAIFEWCDIFFICVWSCVATWRTRRGYIVGIQEPSTQLAPVVGKSADECSSSQPVLFLSARTLTGVSLVLYLGTLVSCCYLVFHQGRVPAGSWPMISDMWVYPPGNWISRWAIVQGASYMTMVHVCLYYLGGIKTRWTQALTLLSIVSILGLAVVGCVNESENIIIHSIGAVVFFVGYDAFMLLRTATLATSSDAESDTTYQRCILVALTGCAVVSTVLTCFRFFPKDAVLRGPQHLLGPILEWLDAVLIMAYAVLSVSFYGSKTRTTGLSIVPSQDWDERAVALISPADMSKPVLGP